MDIQNFHFKEFDCKGNDKAVKWTKYIKRFDIVISHGYIRSGYDQGLVKAV